MPAITANASRTCEIDSIDQVMEESDMRELTLRVESPEIIINGECYGTAHG